MVGKSQHLEEPGKWGVGGELKKENGGWGEEKKRKEGSQPKVTMWKKLEVNRKTALERGCGSQKPAWLCQAPAQLGCFD